MARPELAPGIPRLITLAAVAVVTLSLYLAKDILMPLALGILLSFLLAPLVTRVERLGAGRIVAVVLVAALTFAALGATTYLVVGQLVQLADALPQYRQNIRDRVNALRQRPNPIQKAAHSIEVISQELATSQPASAAASAPSPESPVRDLVEEAKAAQASQPMPVRIVESPVSPFRQIWSTLGWTLAPLGQAAIVIVFVVFMLIGREDLRDRLIYLLGRGHIHLTTQALDDASRRISRYLLMQFIINVTYGIPVAAGLWLLGVPNALVWGLMATVLRYLPYIGPWIAASLPVALSLAISTGWMQPLAVIALFIVLELLSNNVMEPWLYGSSTGMSSVAVIVAAVFWTWLWGPVGLLLATPMTVCLVVAGKYVPQLEFLTVLLGDQPVWDLSDRFYQRLLAMDEDEANELIEDYLQDASLVAVYDDVVLPALHLAERDRHRGVLSPDQEEFIRHSIDGLVDDLEASTAPVENPAADAAAEESPAPSAKTNGKIPARPALPTAAQTPEPPLNPPRVLCMPARDPADELATRIFVQVLRKAGFPAEAASVDSLASELLEQVARSGAQIVCISALPPAAIAHSRYLCKRLRARFEKIKLMVGLWNLRGDLAKARERLTCIGGDKIVRTLREALEEIRQFNVPLTDPAAPQSVAGSV